MTALDQLIGSTHSPVVDRAGQTQHSRAFWIGLVVMVLSLISGLATYLILTNLTPIVPRGDVVFVVLAVNVVLILAMLTVIAWQIGGLWRGWRDKVAGIRLHIRIVALFSIISAIPALLLALAATTSFARSLDTWFASRPRQIIQESVVVAKAYLDEHGKIIRSDLVNMARDLDNAPVEVRTDPNRLHAQLIGQAGLRDLAIANIIDQTGRIAIKGVEDDRLRFEPPNAQTIQQAANGQVPILLPGATFRVAAVVRLKSFPGFYLYAARGVNPQVVRFLRATRARLDEYELIRKSRGPLTVVHGIMYSMTALTAMLAAIWAGFWFARRFVDPIGRIIGAAQEISRGNLAVQLPVIRGEGDLRRLSQTFNTMTTELGTQRDALISANSQLMERRQFMEAVLSGVTAGVLGLDADGRITIANSSAERLLGTRSDDLIGRLLTDVVPAVAEIHASSMEEIKTRAPVEIKMSINGEERTFSVRVTHQGETSSPQPAAVLPAGNSSTPAAEQGAVVTFDDITDLVSAQRTSAWGEVARRLAHEIKNPLTPIILSAERIRRKYGRVITEDVETFNKLTATIERQAGDIKTMVDEFASFARVPKPIMELQDIRDVVQDPVILFRESNPALTYHLDMPDQPVMAMIDRRLISQALTNLVKNASEAVESAPEASEPGWQGRVDAVIRTHGDVLEIEVIDNGPGLPKQNRARLLEPYVTNKGAKGTGLGLAIVQKIVEQHGGALTLEDAPPAPGRPHGALIRISLPSRVPKSDAAEAAAAAE